MFAVRRRRALQKSESKAPYVGSPSTRRRQRALGIQGAFIVLLAARILSALFNIVHDCDEVYNYWEPLHYLLYGYGMQTWEYSSEFALRSYLYLLLHSPPAVLSAVLAGAGPGKVYVFYAIKAFLGLVSTCAETALYRATRDYAGAAAGHYLLIFLSLSSGMFVAATSLLPSSFAMYAVTWAAAGVLQARATQVVVAAVVCVVWGWPVAGAALLPYAFFVLFSKPVLRSFTTLLAVLGATAAPLVAVDRLFYGKWTISLLNFVRYNVIGGGDSSLYGVESPSYYLTNGALNLNMAFVLALAAPLVLLFRSTRNSAGGVQWRLVIAVSPVWVWLVAISSLPHKEERFLYVVYPLVCLGAASVLAALPLFIYRLTSGVLPRRVCSYMADWLPYSMVLLFTVLSLSRAIALVTNYGAPMQIYRHLPEIPEGKPGGEAYVCTGDEWHRFPSAFFLPSPAYRLAFLKSGFGGLLPRPFNFEQGGTAAASEYLNNQNREEPQNYWLDDVRCSYLVKIRRRPSNGRDIDATVWQERASLPFVLGSESPSRLARALFIPWLSARKNTYADYVLYEKVPAVSHKPGLN